MAIFPEPSLPASARVLLVDDAEDHVYLIRRLLERSRTPRYEFESTGDPQDAVARISSGAYDAILLDYRLPGKNGVEVLRELNREVRRPVIGLTAQGDERTAVDFFHAGAYDYLQKTMDPGFCDTLKRALRDLLRRRALEREIERERRRSGALLESLPTMVCCLDRELRIRETNRSFRELFHRWRHAGEPDAPPENPAGISLADLKPSGDRWTQHAEKLRMLLQGSEPYQEEIEILVAGQPRLFWALASPLRVEGETEGIVLSMTDLTDQRSALHQLFRLARAVDSSKDGVVITDPRGRIEYVNPAFARLAGYEPEEILSRRSCFPQISPGRGEVGAAIREKLGRGEEWHGEVVNRRKDGSLYFADMTISPIRDDAGQLLGFVSTERDVTERKVFTDELIKAREAAEESLRAKDQFLATVSHELRTPLTSIIGFADLLLLESSLPEHCRGFCESIMRGGRHLKRLIDNILDLSRFAAGRFYLDLEPLPLRAILGEVAEMVRPEAEAKSLGVDLVVDDGLPEVVVADRMKLQQVLLNLLSNAVKFSREGRVELMARPLFLGGDRAEAPDRVPRMLLLSVRDQGPGIPDEQQARIFEEFVQLGEGVQRKGGTGLGLAISRRLVELMGGSIWVDSRPGQGACFSFTLPLATPQQGGNGQRLSEGREVVGGPRLLLHRLDAGTLPCEAELTTWGYRIAVTGNQEGLQRVLNVEEPFACVVAGTSQPSSALAQIAEAALLVGDGVAWFLFGRTPDGEPVALGRIVPLGEELDLRAGTRLIRALESLPAGARRLFVDPEDAETSAWARETLGQKGITIQPVPSDAAGLEFGPEEGSVLLLDLARAPVRAWDLFREIADRCPRLLLALRYPRGSDALWTERLDGAWTAVAEGFRERAPQRLRWILNAIHTAASQGRLAAASLFADEVLPEQETVESVARPGRPILVVEDNDENRHLLCRMLDSLGLPHRAARDGREALEIAGRERPSLVLMDIQMPGLDGCEATRAFHRVSGSEHLPIVAMTAHVAPEDRHRCHAAGCVDFLAKPIERGDLVRALHRWLGRGRLEPTDGTWPAISASGPAEAGHSKLTGSAGPS